MLIDRKHSKLIAKEVSAETGLIASLNDSSSEPKVAIHANERQLIAKNGETVVLDWASNDAPNPNVPILRINDADGTSWLAFVGDSAGDGNYTSGDPFFKDSVTINPSSRASEGDKLFIGTWNNTGAFIIAHTSESGHSYLNLRQDSETDWLKFDCESMTTSGDPNFQDSVTFANGITLDGVTRTNWTEIAARSLSEVLEVGNLALGLDILGVGQFSTERIQDLTLVTFCDVGGRYFCNNAGEITVDVDEQTLTLAGSTATLDWANKNLIGGWTFDGGSALNSITQADSIATTVADLKTDFNSLLANLRSIQILAT